MRLDAVDYAGRRLLSLLPVWVGVSLFAFSLANLTPGDPAEIILQRQSDEPPTTEAVERLREKMGLDAPFVLRYGRWARSAVSGDLGESYSTGEPVSRTLANRLPSTLQLAAAALLLGIFIAIPLGVISAVNRGKSLDHRRLEGPSQMHLLGTDNLGRDLMSRLIWGSRWSLGTVSLATVLIMSIGLAVGTIAGYYGGIVDDVLMRLVDMLLAFPSLLLALAIAGMLGPGITSVIIALVSVWWASYARIVRGLVLGMRERDFIAAARGLGGGDRHIIFRHVLPNVLPSIAVLATLEMGDLILAVAGLGFLGVGVQPPVAEWGTMVNEGRAFLLSAPQLMIYPGLAISAAVIGFNLLGDGLRDMLDPRLSLPRRRILRYSTGAV